MGTKTLVLHPKISVIIPVYNTEKYLDKCLVSIQNQSIKEIEILCIDDGSTDNSLKILKKYTKSDKRIRIIPQKNSGAGAARNTGIAASKGEYLSFIDSDDWLDKDFFKNVYTCAKNSGADVVEATQSYNCYKGGKTVLFNKKKAVGFMANGSYFRRDVIWDKLYRADFVKSHNILFPNGLCHNDGFFLLQALYYRAKIVRENNAVYFHNKANETSIRYKPSDKKLLSMLDMFLIEINFLNSHFFSFYDYRHNYRKLLHTAKLKRRYIKEKNNILKYQEKLNKIISLYKYPSTLQILWKKLTSPRFREELKNSKARPEEYPKILKEWYYKKQHKNLDLEFPKTFNEKIQWLKLYDSTPEKTRLADKFLVREWIKEKIGDKYLIPLLGCYNSFDEIDFNSLPDQFILKCNHGSGMNKIVLNKKNINYKKTKKQFDAWMLENFGFTKGLQIHYNNIPHKIIAEKYVTPLEDYKFYCYNGKCHHVLNKMWQGENGSYYNFDLQFNCLKLSPKSGCKKITPPKNFQEMLEIAEKLAKGFIFVRVDLYASGENIYFGEMTFTPASGVNSYTDEWDKKLGDLISLKRKDNK